MSKLKTSLARMSFVVCAISLASLLSGCEAPGENSSASQTKRAKHSHLTFHRPKSLTTAVERLCAINEAVAGEREICQLPRSMNTLK